MKYIEELFNTSQKNGVVKIGRKKIVSPEELRDYIIGDCSTRIRELGFKDFEFEEFCVDLLEYNMEFLEDKVSELSNFITFANETGPFPALTKIIIDKYNNRIKKALADGKRKDR